MAFIGRMVCFARFRSVLTSAVTVQLAKFAGCRELAVFHFLSDACMNDVRAGTASQLRPSEQIMNVRNQIMMCSFDIVCAAAAICVEM
jgi:hypothetical protein